jgi:hypothetical protein
MAPELLDARSAEPLDSVVRAAHCHFASLPERGRPSAQFGAACPPCVSGSAK